MSPTLTGRLERPKVEAVTLKPPAELRLLPLEVEAVTLKLLGLFLPLLGLLEGPITVRG